MARAFVDTDSQLAAILGVSRQAIARAEARGTITRLPSGQWDAVAALEDWRDNTCAGLQRPGQAREFRPWLSPEVELTDPIWDEFCRRCDREGAEWEEEDDDEGDQDEGEEDWEEDGEDA
jgi:hypothetical protein